MIDVSEVVLTFRSRVELRDGRVVKPVTDGFLGPLDTEITDGGGAWYLGVREGPHGDGALPYEFVSSREIVAIRVVGDWDEWPAVVAGHGERPPTWPDYLREGRTK